MLILRDKKRNKDYGIFGDTTSIIYEDGGVAQIGDVVEKIDDKGRIYGNGFVCKNEEWGGFVMGIANEYNDSNFRKSDWRIKLVSKFYNQSVGKMYSGLEITKHEPTKKKITIDGKEIYLSIESFNALKEQLC